MNFQYKVDTFVPNILGCGSKDNGWDKLRCVQYQKFLNEYAKQGWRLNSSDFRLASAAGCGGQKGLILVCVFEMAECNI